MTQTIQQQCPQCNHYKTCLIHRGLNQILTQHFTKKHQPFQVNQLAEICTAYQSATTINTLLSDLQENTEEK